MSTPSPLKQYHFHVILIWLHSPYVYCKEKKMKDLIILLVINSSGQVTSLF
jgi:hypothetical protein